MTIGIYCRVSTEEQRLKGVSLDDQKKRGIEFCEKNGYNYEVFDDGGYSGELSIQDRPGLNKLLEKIYLKEIQGVYIVDFDRFSRDEKDGFVIKKTLIDEQIKLFDTHGEINLNDENQELLLGIKILLSSFELKKLKVRIKRSLERSVIEGRVGGGPVLNYGFKKGEKKQLEIDEVEADVVKLIYQMCIDGKGTKVIANYLNEQKIPTKRNSNKSGSLKVRGVKKTEFLWRDSVVYRILTNPIYKGSRLFKGKEYVSPKIIEPSIFDVVQTLLKERKNLKDTTNKYFYLLKGKIICGECKSRFYGRKREDLSDNQYICSSQRYRDTYCGTRGINIDYLDNLILNEVKGLGENINKFYSWYEKTEQYKSQMGRLFIARREEKELEKKIENLIELGLTKSIKEEYFTKTMEKLNSELDKVREKKLETQKQLTLNDKKEDIIRIVKQHLEDLESEVSNERKREILRSVIDNIYILWDKKRSKHIILLDYKIDKLTQFRLGKEIELDYKQSGWRLDRMKVFSNQLLIRRMIGDIFNGLEGGQVPHIKIN